MGIVKTGRSDKHPVINDYGAVDSSFHRIHMLQRYCHNNSSWLSSAWWNNLHNFLFWEKNQSMSLMILHFKCLVLFVSLCWASDESAKRFTVIPVHVRKIYQLTSIWFHCLINFCNSKLPPYVIVSRNATGHVIHMKGVGFEVFDWLSHFISFKSVCIQ